MTLSFESSAQIITTYAGNGMQGYGGDGQQAINASIGFPGGVSFSDDGSCFFTEYNNTIRKISPTGIITTIAGNGTQGFSGDGNLATMAQLYGPSHIAVDNSGNVFFTDFYNNRIRKIDVGNGFITTVAGNGTGGFNGDSGLAIQATLYSPNGIAIDDANNLYFSDYGNHRIRKIDINGIITTIAGNGGLVDSGDGGFATNASLLAPQGIAISKQHKLYIADSKRIRIVDLNTGIINTIAGDGTFGYGGDGGPADSAKFLLASDVAIGTNGRLFITDQSNHRIRSVELNNIINTSVGNGIAGYNGDGGFADTSELNSPRGITLDSCGNLYVADNGNHRIRKIAFNPTCSPEIVTGKILQTSIVFYPNPATKQLTIKSHRAKTIAVTNTMGQVVIEEVNNNGDEATINVSSLAAGVYFVKVSDKDGNVVTKRFVKE
jgi:sugar lactone lactonase YvrE